MTKCGDGTGGHMQMPRAGAPGWRRVWQDLGPAYVSNGLIAFVFTATGPLAIILSVGSQGGLSQAELASWVFGCFAVNGLISLVMSWRHRMPLGFAYTIPGTVLVGPALQHLSFAEVVGAFHVTSLVVVLLGASGLVRRLMAVLPMPVVMGMVAGVFLRFGLDLIRALHGDALLAAPMMVVFLVLSAVPAWGRRLPPVIGALLAGLLILAGSGRMAGVTLGELALAAPVLQQPAWSWPALMALVLPLSITVLVVQNGQGLAVLRASGHQPPVDRIAVMSGLGSALSAAVGAVSSCLSGPGNALLSGSGERSRQYTAALVYGACITVFGLLAPTFTGLMLSAPRTFVMVVAGLAMLRVLQGAFVGAFGQGRFSLGALVCMLVTVADITVFNIGAAFWGLLAGFAMSLLLERKDFTAAPGRP